MGNELMNTEQETTSGGIMVESQRAIQEVQAALVIAKKFPRDEVKAIARIVENCKRKRLAEVAVYAFPRGGETITGPSIRLAETIAQAWGNIDFGVEEMDRGIDEHGSFSDCKAYSWDMETNTRRNQKFRVYHQRKANKTMKKLEDERDIYEHVAKNGASRMRSCILAIIPGDVVEKALEQIEKTMSGDISEPLRDRSLKIIQGFAPLGISQEMIEKRMKHLISEISETELAELRAIYTSIKDGATKREDWFKGFDDNVDNDILKGKKTEQGGQQA